MQKHTRFKLQSNTMIHKANRFHFVSMHKFPMLTQKILEVEGICETQTFKYFNLFLESYFPIYVNRSYTWISTWNGISQLAFRFHALRLPHRYILLVRAKLVSCSSCSTASSDCYTVRGWASVTMLSHLMSRESEKCLYSFHICLSLLQKKGCIFTLTLPSYV